MDKTDKNKKLEAFAQILLQRGKESGMVWNGVNWVPAEGASKTSPTSPKSPKPVSSSSTKKSVNFFKDFKKTIIPIANEISLIKKAVVRFSANQEKIKKEEDDQRRKEKNEKYLSKYKRPTVQKIDPDKKGGGNLSSLFGSLINLFTGIIKFFLIGFGLILLADFLKKAGVKDAIKNFIKKVLEVVSDLITKGAELIHDILKPGEISNKIIDFIQLVINTVLKVASDFTEFLRNFVNKISSDQELLSKLQTIIENIVTTIFTVVMTAIESIKESISKFGPEISKAILDGVIFILNGIASGIQYVTTFFNSQEFRQSFADLVQSVYDLIVSILNVEIPVPGLGSVKLITLILAVEGTVLAAKLALSTLTASIYGWIAKRALSSAIGGMDCSGVLGGKGGTGTSGKPGKRKKGFFETGANLLQWGGLAAGATALYSTISGVYERGEQLDEKYEDAPTVDPSTTANQQAPTQNYVDQKPPSQTPTQTGVSTTVNNSFVAPPASLTNSSVPSSPTAPSPARPVNQNPPGMPRSLEEYIGMEFERKKAREGFRNKAYASPEGGTDTIGIGHKLSNAEQNAGGVFIGGRLVKADRNTPLTDQQVKDLYIQDVMNHANGAKRQVNSLAGQDVWTGLNPMQQYALMDLSFAGGPGLITKDLADAIKSGDMNRASQIIQQKARTYRRNGVMVESKHHARHADLRADIFRGYDPLLSGGTPTALASYTPNEQRQSKPYPSSPSSLPTQVAQASPGSSGQQNQDKDDILNLLSGERMKAMKLEGNIGGGSTSDYDRNKAAATMSFSPKIAGAELKTSSKEVQNLMDQNDVLNRMLTRTASGESAAKDTVISKTATNSFAESGSNKLDLVYDEDFVGKLLGTSVA